MSVISDTSIYAAVLQPRAKAPSTNIYFSEIWSHKGYDRHCRTFRQYDVVDVRISRIVNEKGLTAVISCLSVGFSRKYLGPGYFINKLQLSLSLCTRKYINH